eukprot:213980-Chlamydomonas_euryale.AAC.1
MSTGGVWTRVYGHVQRCPDGHVQIMRQDVHGHVHRHLWTAGQGQPAHTPPQQPPGAERKGSHKGRKNYLNRTIPVRDAGIEPTTSGLANRYFPECTAFV